MTDWQLVFLGVMAASLVAIAVVQVLQSIALLRATRQMSEAVTKLQRDLGPLIDKANRMTDDAARVTALALTQAERIDQFVASMTTRVESTLTTVQDAIGQPARQGAAFVAALRAVVGAIREGQRRRPAASDDDGPLFVG